MTISSKLISVILISALGVSMALAQGGGGGGRGQGGRGGNQFSELRLLARKDVQKDLGLTDDQVTKIEEYTTKNTPQRGQGGGGAGAGGGGGNGGGGNGGGGQGGAGGGQLTDEQRAAFAKAAAERRAKTRADLLGIVSEAQLNRVDAIALQLQGNMVVTQAEMQKTLGMTEAQIASIKELSTKLNDANRVLGQKVRDQEMTREEATAARTTNTDRMKTELGKIITADQAAKLKAMQGKTFTPDEGGN